VAYTAFMLENLRYRKVWNFRYTSSFLLCWYKKFASRSLPRPSSAAAFCCRQSTSPPPPKSRSRQGTPCTAPHQQAACTLFAVHSRRLI